MKLNLSLNQKKKLESIFTNLEAPDTFVAEAKLKAAICRLTSNERSLLGYALNVDIEDESSEED